MKGPFGMLLVGGGIILLIGLFTGKITFPGVPGGPGQQLSVADKQKIIKNAGGVNPDKNGNCPANYTLMGGVCIPNSVLGQI